MQVKPGEYNSDALEMLDFLMETARGLGMKVMLSFADNWKWQGRHPLCHLLRAVSLASTLQPHPLDIDFSEGKGRINESAVNSAVRVLARHL